MRRRLTRDIRSHEEIAFIPVFAPLEVNSQGELLVNNEKFLMGQAVRLSNGVNPLKANHTNDSESADS